MEWRARRWRRLLNIIEQLPRTSAYAQALSLDPELARRLAAMPEAERKGKWQRQFREYTAEVEMLSAVFDRLGEQVRVHAASRGAKSYQPTPAPRPIPAIEPIRRLLVEERHRKMVARVLPPE